MSDARSRRAATAPAARWDPSPRDEPARWGPVLAGREQDEALTVATAIAAELTTWPTTGATLAGGSAGRALLHARFADDADQRDAGRTALRHAVGSLRTPGGPASLHLGAAGVGFVVAHLAGDLLDRRDRCGGVDRALTSLVDREPWTGLLDLMRGLVGIGVYALERLEVPAGPQLLARVVEHLDQAALRTPDGRTWWTPAEQLPDPVPACVAGRPRRPRGRPRRAGDRRTARGRLRGGRRHRGRPTAAARRGRVAAGHQRARRPGADELVDPRATEPRWDRVLLLSSAVGR